MKTAIGIAIVALHVAAFVVFADRWRGVDLSVELHAPLASPTLALDGKVPDAIASRVETHVEPGGLARKTWGVRYRGGYARSIGAAQLVGPFQDPTGHACSGRVVVGQRLLDDGSGSASTVAGQMKTALNAELKGESIVGIGDFVRVDKLHLAWAQLDKHPEDKRLVKAAPNGYARVTATIVFEHAAVPLTLALLPVVKPDKIQFTIYARAELELDNRFLQWLSDRLGGDKLATRFTRREIDNGLVTALQPPPPFDLGGQTITFQYCDGAPEIVDNAYGALPFGVAIGKVERDPTILPPLHGASPHAPISPNAALAIDLDLDALNALLYELWRTGYLDQRLADAGLDKRFNADPIVTEFLSVRISAPRLALPPVLAPNMRLSADARVTIDDRGLQTIGRVWGGLDFSFANGMATDLGALELSCERGPLLVPCYADLVNAIRDRGAEFHGELTKTFAKLLDEIFVERRLSDPSLPADLVIKSASPSVMKSANNAALHLDLDAALVSRP